MLVVKCFDVPPDGKWHLPPTDKRIDSMKAPFGCEVDITPGRVRNVTDRPLSVEYTEIDDA